MTITTEIIWTVLPNGIHANGRLRASILVSPRVVITSPDTSMPIVDHLWFRDWPATLKAAGSLQVAFGRFDTRAEDVAELEIEQQYAVVRSGMRTMWTDIFSQSFASPLPASPKGRVERIGELDALDAHKTLMRAIVVNRTGARVVSEKETTQAVGVQRQMLERLMSLNAGGNTKQMAQGKAKGKENDPLEFHRLVAGVTSYHALARELGLVLEVSFKADLPSVGWIRMIPPTLTPISNCEHKLPKTALERTIAPRPLFRSLLAKEAPQNVPPPNPQLAQGFGSLTESRLIHLHSTTTTPEDPVATANRSSGTPSLPLIPDQLLLMNPRVADLLNLWTERTNTLSAAGTESVLFADDLVCGMAIDLQMTKKLNAPWESLCERQGRYATGPIGPSELVLPQVRTPVAAQIGELASTNKRFGSDVFLRLDGWSLVCDRPNTTLDEAGGRKLKTIGVLRDTLEPPPGSLPKLRYGQEYLCRARAIDLVGNDMSAAGFVPPADDQILKFIFNRFEPIKPPMIVATTVHPTIQTGARDPQATHIMAIGYEFQTDHGKYDHREQEVRHLLPPKAGSSSVEYSGVLDEVRDDADAYNLLKRLDVPPPEIFADGQAIQHLPDPFAHGVRLRGLPGAAELMREFGGRWPRSRAMKLIARPKPHAHDAAERERLLDQILADPDNAGSVTNPLGEDEHPSGSGAEITVRVRPGFRHEVRISSWIGANENRHHIFETSREDGFLRISEFERTLDAAADLQRDLATPAGVMELVHPVASPIFRPRIIKERHPLVRSQDGSTHAIPALGTHEADISFLTMHHHATTGRLEVIARWIEPADIDNIGNTIEFVVTQREAAHLPADSIPATLGRLNLAMAEISTKHRFDDGKYRFVSYSLRALTRFSEYFTDTEIRRSALIGNSLSVHIHATEPPPPPIIARILPTFRTTVLPPGSGQATHARLIGLRIYLERPWNASGSGELLAVLERCRSANVPAIRMASQNVSVWANDPARRDRATGAITTLAFRHMRASNELYPEGIAPARIIDSFELERGDERGLLVKINGYEPRGAGPEIVCDIDVAVEDPKNDGVFYPFVKLAIARYQHCAVPGAILSDIIFATFVQLPASRTLELTENGRDVRVTVRGPGRYTRMCFQFVPRSRSQIPAANQSTSAPIESEDPALLVPSPDAASWRELAQGAWTYEGRAPRGKHWLVITEEENLGGVSQLLTVCRLEIG